MILTGRFTIFQPAPALPLGEGSKFSTGILQHSFQFAFHKTVKIKPKYFLAGAHLAEETRGAGRAGKITLIKKNLSSINLSFCILAPKGIIATCVCAAIIGFIYLLGLLFAIPNIDSFLKKYNTNDESINLAVATYELAAPHRVAMALTTLVILNVYFAGISSITVTSRILYIEIIFS